MIWVVKEPFQVLVLPSPKSKIVPWASSVTEVPLPEVVRMKGEPGTEQEKPGAGFTLQLLANPGPKPPTAGRSNRRLTKGAALVNVMNPLIPVLGGKSLIVPVPANAGPRLPLPTLVMLVPKPT